MLENEEVIKEEEDTDKKETDIQEEAEVTDEEQTSKEDTLSGNKDDAEDNKDEAENEEDITSDSSENEDSRIKDEEGKEKKKFFKKNKKDKKDEQIEALTDQVKRQMAEFDNFRKRTEKEKSSMYEMGAKSVVEKILPVIDNFERGLDTVSEEDKNSPFAEGMRMIYKQLMTELEGIGVKPIEALGQEFNPDFHNAVMQVESEEYESGHVAQELQKGYMYRDSIVRHSMVAVVQ
ncbi:MAG: nucleotide exchange factor GrpE [Lachnospiraceae bacterium]|nr:nucleotide exchange factor GrpE [Lachnospiraceae bacterium]